eukprot:TRINITY_DN14667_c0_g1_i1.p1 TRINITY_DN14667_c0_g1~~TRINITY_DN14667_c0_g1_i1.p1  ORF type:complete len:284 (-),score=78.60 TRINITY_DN14667_c0_g1_i1:61-912(-)
MPCNNCSACLMNDCGGCKFCLDKRKFGGPGKLKKRCEMRQCVIPKKVGGSATTKSTTIATSSTTFLQKQPEIRNKFLASVEIEDSDMNSSFEDSFSIKTIGDGDESPTLAADQKASLQNFIYNGLETFEVVTVTPAEDKPCYICKTNTTEDLFYCSSCYDPFHPFCLHMQNLPQPKEPQSGSLCSRCIGGKGDYEQDMNDRAKSIDAKCEEINGKQYQVISFLSEPEQEKLNAESVLLDQVFMSEPLPVPSFGLQSLNELPQSYDVDFDKYLQTNGLAICLNN